MHNLTYIQFVLSFILSISICVYNVKDNSLYTESKAVHLKHRKGQNKVNCIS